MFKHKKLVFFLFALTAFIAGVFISKDVVWKKPIDISHFHGTLLEEPRDLSPFELVGIDGKPFNQASLKGHWTLMFFGFTNCGSVCPTTMAELTKTYKLLQARGVEPLPHVVMVSIDPKRDTQSKLAHYVKAFHVTFYGAYGSAHALDAMTQEIGVAYARIPNPKVQKNYDIEHTGAVMLINPNAQLNAFFTLPHRAKWLADDYQLLINQGNTYS